MKEILITWLPWAIAALLGLAVALWRKYGTPKNLVAVAEKIIPNRFDPLIQQIVQMVVDAVDQRVKKYGTLTNADRLALAKKYMDDLLSYYGIHLGDLAKEALLEAEIWLRHKVIDGQAQPVTQAGTPASGGK